MKIFFLTFLFFHLVQSLKYGLAFREKQLIHLYRKATDYYSGNRDFFANPFRPFHNKLVRLVLDSFRENPKSFLELVRQKESRPLAHFVLLALSYMSDNETWIEHSDPTYSPFKFFERAKNFAFSLFMEKDWISQREMLSVLLSIQEQYLSHLDSKVHDINQVREWMSIQQEIIAYPHDLCSNETLLQLFYQLQSLARRYKGEIPEKGRNKSLIEGFLHLFRYSLQYLLSKNWVASDITLFPPKLIYVAILQRTLQSSNSGILIFACLKDPKSFSSVNLNLFSYNFMTLRTIYELEFKTKTTSHFQAFQANSKFRKFLRELIAKKETFPFNMKKKDFWFIEAILYISSNLHDCDKL
jgi:hypothetical protein